MPASLDLLTWAVLSGMAAVAGLTLVVVGSARRTPRLSDALRALDAAPARQVGAPDLGGSDEWDARLGRWAYTHAHLPVSDRTWRRLQLSGRSVGEFLAEKLILAVAGAAAPQLAAAAASLLGVRLAMVPVGASLVLAAAGYLWPTLRLRRGEHETHEQARHAILTLFDLVTLERLANQSAIGALESAAGLSDALVFRRIREAADRARLEQRAPWSDLRALADELSLPEISDLCDVLQLDEQGAALAGSLRARVKELRGADLLREKTRAQRAAESMTVWMVIPSLVLGVLLIAPPLLKLGGTG
ncbi:MAG TPA: hypothetical protein VHO26_10635 [Propionibacteriaceae bacterium]|nr:hypothetical protein [Propionibacteriaceae bacterium]